MLYMIEACSTGDYSFVTSSYGAMTLEAAKVRCWVLNRKMQSMRSPTIFYPTPILDI